MRHFSISFDKVIATLTCEPYELALLSTFGTAHSATTSRTNVLVSTHLVARDSDGASSREVVGFGEIGLPPKKPLCYLADLESVERYFVAFEARCRSSSAAVGEVSHAAYDPFAALPSSYFAAL